jgi:NAD(P)-dependent dehydrogenase (short-subunit alcohol dehydrogenase family)
MPMTPGKAVLITGCSTGFGRALVPILLGKRWVVIATLRDAQKRKDIFSQEQQQHPDSFHVLSLDVASAPERKKIVDFIHDHYQKLDVLINNAGYGLFGALEDLSESQLRHEMEANFFGAAFLTRDLLPWLRQAKGKVINISSLLGGFGFPLSSGYCSSKFALEGLSECLYYELKPHGVQVCLVKPGRHRTDFSRHMVWGEKSSTSASSYNRQTEKFESSRNNWRERSAIPLENVVRIVAHLAEADSMPLRVHIGNDAWLVKLLQTFLPEKLRTAFLSAVYKRIF